MCWLRTSPPYNRLHKKPLLALTVPPRFVGACVAGFVSGLISGLRLLFCRRFYTYNLILAFWPLLAIGLLLIPSTTLEISSGLSDASYRSVRNKCALHSVTLILRSCTSQIRNSIRITRDFWAIWPLHLLASPRLDDGLEFHADTCGKNVFARCARQRRSFITDSIFASTSMNLEFPHIDSASASSRS